MHGTRVLGIVLLVLGVAVLVFEGLTWASTETVVDLGQIQIQAHKERKVPLEPIAAGLAVVGGLALIGVRNKS